MRLRQEMVNGLNELVNKGSRQVDLAKNIGVTSQHVGRILKGQPNSVADEVGVRICEMLGLPVEYSVETPRRYFFEVQYRGLDMQPILSDGQVLFCEPTTIGQIQDDELVLCEFERRNKAGQKEIVTTIRYWKPVENLIVLRPEYYMGKTYETTVPQIQWVARVLHPVRRLKIVDATKPSERRDR